jgi:hypothetical protein
MVIGDLNIERIAASPNEANAILSTDANAVLPSAIAAQGLQPKAGAS